MANPTNNTVNEPINDAQMSGKRRRKKSVVWEHFTIETIDSGCTRARCMQCKRLFAYISGSKLAGTSHLKRHISLGICPAGRNHEKNGQISPCTPLPAITNGQKVNNISRKRNKFNSGSSNVSLYQDRCTNSIAKMIIMHEYPLDIVECPAFLNFVKSTQPHFTVLPLADIERDCVGLYQRERDHLLNGIDRISGHVNLSVDFWSTDQSVGYAVITEQFVDEDWNLHRRILSVVLLPFPDSDSAFNHAVYSCINDWNLENKLLAVTLDESFANKDVRNNLVNLISAKSRLILEGKFLIGSCYGRVLCNLAKDALGLLQETVKKVRDSVKYVVTNEFIQKTFDDLKLQLQVPSAKTLILDDQTKWDTTYYMLAAANELKEVFSCLDTFDPNYQNTLTMDEWKQVGILCNNLKHVLDAANLVTGPMYPTSNAFFHKVYELQTELRNAAAAALSDDVLTRSMHERFNKYWKDCFLVLSIAVVMDPRFKMKLMEFCFGRLYGEDAVHWIKTVYDCVRELFVDYVLQMLPTPTFDLDIIHEEKEPIPRYDIVKTENENEIFLSTSDGELDGFDIYVSGMTNHQNVTRELDQYLEESVLPRMQEFDVLGWWKLNRKKYPTLSKMASDILSIPVSTVFQDSVFDMTCKKMDRYKCSLRPSTVEALVCAKDWMQNGNFSDYFPLVSSKSMVKSEF